MALQHLDPHLRFKIEEIRRRCARRKLQQGLFGLATGSLILIAVFVLLFQLLEPEHSSRGVLVFLFWAVELLLIWRYVIRPLRKPVTHEQIALFIDERFPELQDRMISMVSLAEKDEDQRISWLADAFLKESRHFVVRSPFATRWDPGPAPEWRSWLTVALVVGCALLLYRFPTVWVPFSFEGWLVPKSAFTVTPGNARVRIGEDETVLVKSKHTSMAVTIRWRDAGGSWRTAPMSLGDSDQVHYHRFADIRGDIAYQILFGPWKSSKFNLKAWMPPEVLSIDLTYHYPEYLDLPSRETPNSGQITAVAGSTVELEIQANKPLRTATLVFESGREVPLEARQNAQWTARFIVEENDQYHIALTDRDGSDSVFNPGYDVVVKEDAPPEIRIQFPSRDMEVSAIDEIDFTFRVNDDYGLNGFGVRYQVAGREPVDIPLETASKSAAEGAYQLKLEDLNLQIGDLLTWTVWANDRKPDRKAYEIAGHPYFLEIRPFLRRFKEAVSNQGGMSGGPGQGDSPLVRQKNVLIATWSLRKEAHALDATAFEEKRTVIHDEQVGIREQVGENMRPEGRDGELVRDLIEAMGNAEDALKSAAWPEPEERLSQAATAEQAAYRLLLKLEPDQANVQRNNMSASGGKSDPRRMTGMDDLEMTRNRNFYEDEKRTREEQEAMEKTLDKIKELARRQEMVNREIAKLISELEQREDEASRRRLERLREEAKKNLDKLDEIQRDLSELNPNQSKETAENLDQIRQQMNQGLEDLQQDRLQEARAAGSSAVDNLRDLENKLEQQARGSAGERVEALQRKLAELENIQEQVRDQVKGLNNVKDSPALSAEDPSHKLKQQVLEEKERLAERFKDILEDASNLAEMSQSSQTLLSRKVGDWLRETSRDGILEEIDETREMVQYGFWNELDEKEAAVQQKLRAAAKRFEGVRDLLVSDELQAREKALETLKDLIAEAPGQAGSTEDIRQFLESDYKQWLEQIEQAEGWLGDGGVAPRNLRAIRREIRRFRRDYRDKGIFPEASLLLETVTKPLTKTAAQLELEISALRKERQFLLRDDGSIPDRYRKSVSRYFQRLSESEGVNRE